MRKGQAILALLSDRPVAYHPDVARIVGGVKAAVFLCQLLYWTGREARTDGFIWKTQVEMEKETALTRHEQEGARKKLRSLGVLEEKRAGIPAKLHYRVDTDKLLQSIERFYSKQECGKPANSDGENPQTIPETTTQITPETTTEGKGATAPPPPVHSFLPRSLDKMTVTAIKALELTDDQWRDVEALEKAGGERKGVLKFITSRLNPSPKKSERDEKMDTLVKAFQDITQIKPPKLVGKTNAETEKLKKAAGATWFRPLWQIVELCDNGAAGAVQLMKVTVALMDKDELTIAAPISLVKIARGEQARRRRMANGSNNGTVDGGRNGAGQTSRFDTTPDDVKRRTLAALADCGARPGRA